MKAAKPKTKAAVPKPRMVPFPQGYTLANWRDTPELAEAFGALCREELMRHVFSVLYNSAPIGLPNTDTANETSASVQLGRIQGYAFAMNVLQSLAVVQKPHAEIPTTWNATEED